MTATDTPAVTDDGFAPEVWTFGGIFPGRKSARVARWYDASRTVLIYSPDKGRHPVIGGQYQVQVKREGNGVIRRGDPAYQGPNPDREWVAQLQADAYAADQQIARGQLERRAARADGELDKAIAPIVAIAAGLNYAQRDALVALVTRKIYRAEREGR